MHPSGSKPQNNGKPPRRILRNEAHAKFMQYLYSSRLRPGELVSQRELCELLDIPMGPMREALKRLEAETVVRLIPQRGVKILDVDEKTVENAFQMRLMFEMTGLEKFMRLGDNAPAIDLLRRTNAVLAEPDTSTELEIEAINLRTSLDHEMHWLFVRSLDNEMANDFFEWVLNRLRLSRLAYRLRDGRDAEVFKEHVEILEHVIAGNLASAQAALTSHLENSQKRVLGISR